MVDIQGLDPLRIALAVASAGVFLAVGIVIGRREVSTEARPANRAFQTFWYGLALLDVFTPATILLRDTLSANFVAMLFLLEFLLLAIVGAIGALVYYFLYVYTGRSWVAWPVILYHVLLMAWLATLFTWANPTAFVKDETGCAAGEYYSAGFCYTKDITKAPGSGLLGLALVLPIILATLSYFLLFFRVQEKAQKFRVGLVSLGFLVWFGSGLVASLISGHYQTASNRIEDTTLNNWVVWSYVVAPVIGLAAALLILFAYAPPAWMRRRLEPAAGA